MKYVLIIIFLLDFIFKYNVYYIYNLVAYHEIHDISCLNDEIYTKFLTIY